MQPQARRRAIVGSIVAVSVLVVAAGTTAFFVIRDQHRHDDVAEATKVAKSYTEKITAYRDKVWTATLVPGPDHPRATKAALNKARVDPPRLAGAPSWGKKHSKAYIAAAALQRDLPVQYDRLERILDDALAGETFVKAANVALAVDLEDFVKSGVVSSTAPFRTIMIPGIEKALQEFDAVPVPAGGKQAEAAVKARLNDMIDQARTVIANLDAGRSGKFDPGRPFFNATDRVATYEGTLSDKVGKGLESIAVRASSSDAA